MENTDLYKTNLSNANLNCANLQGTQLAKTNFEGAQLFNCTIYGLSAWDLNLNGAFQKDLIILYRTENTIHYGELEVSQIKESHIIVDDLRVAQFVYLLLDNENTRHVIDTITSKVVLILGRFSPERKMVLDALREELRTRDYVPIIFDFDKPADRDFTETVLTLAGMSKFIIADLTQPESSPLESHISITNYMIPFIPIIQEGDWPFAMFVDLQRKHHWVLKTLKYKDKDDLIQYVDKIIAKANIKYREIQIEKSKADQKPVSGDEW